MWQAIKNIYHLLQASLASLYFGYPSKKLKIIGVTGTDGKTTTSQMIYEILKAQGEKVSIISSIHAQIGDRSYDTGFHVTTPDPIALQKFLKQIVVEGSRYLVLEVTSHALDQNRIFGVNFTIGVLTNITHEHLDYHKTYENYLKSKAKLFQNTKASVLNADDDSFPKIKKFIQGEIITYGINKKADISLKNFPINLKIPGEYNLYNGLAAAAATSRLGIDKQLIIKNLSRFQGLTGRMERVDEGQDFTVIVDFAHTPNALLNALKTLRLMSKSPKIRLIAVFGAAGERDKTKRPMMGKVAAENADISVITAEDPRTEKVEDICTQIAEGFKQTGKKEGRSFYVVTDREKAIEFAINLARSGDIVATFGKSHEKSMCFGKKEYPWDEFKVVRQALKRKPNDSKR